MFVGFLSNISRDFEVVGGVSIFDSPVISLSYFLHEVRGLVWRGFSLCVLLPDPCTWSAL